MTEISITRSRYLTITILFFAVVFPTKTYGNIGYVDPNLYIGMALDYRWFVENTPTEYHATRVPFILFLKMLLYLPSEYVGLIFKIFVLLGVLFFWLRLSNYLKIERSISISVLPLVLLSPTIISASSWTVEQSFSITLMLIIFGIFLSYESKKRKFILGLLFAFLLNSNFYYFSMTTMAIALYVLANNKLKFKIISVREYISLFGFIIGVFVIQLYWQFSHMSKSAPFWFYQHLKILRVGINGENRGFGEWRNLNLILNSNPSLFISLLFLTITSLFLLYGRNLLQGLNINFYHLALTQFVLLLASWLTYFIGINPQFDSYWYFYPNAVISFFVLGLCIVKMQEKFQITEIVQLFVIASAVYIYLLMFIHSEIMPKLSYVLGFSLLLLVITKFNFLNMFQKKNVLTTSTILAFSIFWISNLSHPAFANAYTPTKQASIDFLEDQKQISNFVSNQIGFVATWTPPDNSGYFGGLISTLGFHTTRLEGRSAALAQPDLEKLERKKDLVYLTLIVPMNYEIDLNSIQSKGFKVNKVQELKSARGLVYELIRRNKIKNP